MNSLKSSLLAGLFVPTLFGAIPAAAQSGGASDAGKFSGVFNFRYESVEQDNALDDAEAFTLSSKLAFTSATVNGFSALLEVENVSRLAGIDNYTVGPSDFNPGRYSVIADPDTTELDQAFVQYSAEGFTAKVGRQVIIYDNHRFVGHVGWRQDRQTFDAVTLALNPNDDLSISYNFLDKRNRIFAEDADIDSTDHLIHAVYNTPLGALTGYAYLLEADKTNNSLDTYGLRLSGARELGGLQTRYLLEYATQESETGPIEFDADYFLIEGGVTLGGINFRIGHEQLGSDNGAYGFSTPLSTLHAHNGWADLFLGTPAQGLVDTYLNIGGQAFSGNWSVVYHDFEADDASTLVDDLGNELDLQYVYPFSERYTLGIKYAKYSSGDATAGKPDTDKFWIWVTARF